MSLRDSLCPLLILKCNSVLCLLNCRAMLVSVTREREMTLARKLSQLVSVLLRVKEFTNLFFVFVVKYSPCKVVDMVMERMSVNSKFSAKASYHYYSPVVFRDLYQCFHIGFVQPQVQVKSFFYSGN